VTGENTIEHSVILFSGRNKFCLLDLNLLMQMNNNVQACHCCDYDANWLL